MNRIAPSVWFSAAGVFAFGAVGFWLAGLTSETRIGLCVLFGVLGSLSHYASFREYYIRVGEHSRAEMINKLATRSVSDSALPSPAQPLAAREQEEPGPNIMPVITHEGRVHLDHATREIRAGDGTRFDTQFTALVVPFRNEPVAGRRVGDAYHVKARVAIGNERYPVTGYWIQSDRDHIEIPVGGYARELVVALRDRDGHIHMVDDHRDENNFRPAELLMFWMSTMPAEPFPVSIQLVSDGTVISETRFSLSPRPFSLAPV